jgi:predicted HicB family RNase H-like nuclease
MRYHRSMNRYTYRVEWSSEYGEYVSRCLEMPWLSQWAPTMREATESVEQAVDAYIAECTATERNVPPPLTERRFSDKFLVRTSSALHARLTVEAAEQNVSMNQWEGAMAPERLDRPPIGLFDL